jgi:beta-fructofuranosidase
MSLSQIKTTMKHTLTLFTVLLLAPLAALHAAEPPPAQQTPATAFLYEPTPGLGMPGVESKGLIADVIPYFWNGQFHLMHLQLNPGQKGWDWAQLVTRDFVDFKDTGVAIPGGGTEDAIDLDIFTGSVFEKDGVVHAFYCGHNPALEKQKKPDQVMLHATSRDGVTWTKDKHFLLTPEGDARYRWPGAFRDGFVFWNPEQKEYGMLVTATPMNAPNGGLAYARSADLKTWKMGEPFPASGRFPGYECPDLFQWGDRWYLIFSTYWRNPGWTTRYMTAPSLQGPWTSPTDDFFDGGTLYAAKSVSDGKRRFLCGTLTRRDTNEKGVSTDEGANGWSGRILIYEMLQRADGTLGVRIPPEVERSFGEPVAVKLPQHPQWAPVEGGGVRAASGPLSAQLGTLPSRCLVSAELTVPPTGRAGFWFGGDKDGKEGFRLFVDVGTQRLAWDRNERPMGSNPEKERNYRPLAMKPGDRIRVKVALDGNAAVACVNDDVCLSTRMYDRRENTFGIWSDTVGSEFANVTLQMPPETEKADAK